MARMAGVWPQGQLLTVRYCYFGIADIVRSGKVAADVNPNFITGRSVLYDIFQLTVGSNSFYHFNMQCGLRTFYMVFFCPCFESIGG